MPIGYWIFEHFLRQVGSLIFEDWHFKLSISIWNSVSWGEKRLHLISPKVILSVRYWLTLYYHRSSSFESAELWKFRACHSMPSFVRLCRTSNTIIWLKHTCFFWLIGGGDTCGNHIFCCDKRMNWVFLRAVHLFNKYNFKFFCKN